MHERHLLLVDAAVPVLVAAVILVGEGLHGGDSTSPLAVVLGLAAAAVLAARRRWPGWTLAASGLLVAVLFHLDRSAAAVAVLAPAVALYSVALRRGRLQQVAAGVVAIAAVATADELHPGRPSLGQSIAHVLLVAVPLLAAEVIRTHQANMRLLIERVELAEQAREQEAQRRAEQERVRIARELHDVLAHTLTEINVTAAAAAEQSTFGAERAVLEQIEHRSHSALGELRAVLGVLRDPASTQAPTTPAPGIDDIAEMINRSRGSGLDVRLDLDGVPPADLSDATSLAAYRIVQESLTNIRRHAAGASAAVWLRFTATHLTITIENGPGIAARKLVTTPGVGIAGMRERAGAIGGRLRATPVADGFRVHTELPYQPAL